MSQGSSLTGSDARPLEDFGEWNLNHWSFTNIFKRLLEVLGPEPPRDHSWCRPFYLDPFSYGAISWRFVLVRDTPTVKIAPTTFTLEEALQRVPAKRTEAEEEEPQQKEEGLRFE